MDINEIMCQNRVKFVFHVDTDELIVLSSWAMWPHFFAHALDHATTDSPSCLTVLPRLALGLDHATIA